MKGKLIALFVLLGSVGLAQAGCSSCGCSKKVAKHGIAETTEKACKTYTCCGCKP